MKRAFLLRLECLGMGGLNLKVFVKPGFSFSIEGF